MRFPNRRRCACARSAWLFVWSCRAVGICTGGFRCFACLVLIIQLLLRSSAYGEFRSFDGTGNNLTNPLWGSAGTDYARMAPVDYANGISTARLTGRPNPRSVGLALMR